MNRKKWAALTLSLLGLSIGGTIGAVVAIDPFEVYHKATAFIPPITNGTQIYCIKNKKNKKTDRYLPVLVLFHITVIRRSVQTVERIQVK